MSDFIAIVVCIYILTQVIAGMVAAAKRAAAFADQMLKTISKHRDGE